MTACKHCGLEVEEARRCYATPVCYACLPPPKPLPIALTEKQVEFLRACAEAVRAPWMTTPPTVVLLEAIAFIERLETGMYIATDAGRAWLKGNDNERE